MSKLLAASLALNAVLVAGLCWKDHSVHAAGGGPTPVGNGDVNGDAQIDISDAVHLLSGLFLGGDPPVPIECPIDCPPPSGNDVPATGQTRCYDSSGNEVDCGSPTFPGQDGSYQLGCPAENRFVDNQNGSVTDACTGLTWTKEAAPGTHTWQQALQYCAELDFAGEDDWRLPSVRELQSIVDYGRSGPAVDPAFSALSDWYWSSSSNAGNPVYGWGVSLVGDGYSTVAAPKSSAVRVLAVRGGR